MMLARDVMRRRVVTVGPDTRLRELLRVFDEHSITGAPVVGPRGDLIGMVSRSDLLREERRADAAAPAGELVVPDLKVQAVMTPWVVCLEEDTPLEEVARQMLAKGIHRVVVTRDGALAGIISGTDMTRALLALLTRAG
jgi:CBS domain-containing protein